MQMMKVRIRTKAPMILSAPGHTSVMTATQDSFSGSVLRGIFAARFIETAALGKRRMRMTTSCASFMAACALLMPIPSSP